MTKNKEISLVYPSELDDTWTKNISEPNLEKPKLLYIGRIKIEKGVFSLFNIFNKIQDDIVLSVVGKVEDKEKINNEKINFIDYEHDPGKLIEIYDNHNISILPSFTEAHPKVLDESLARLRPIIIFKDIEHVINNKKGIFVSQRDPSSLKNTINYIIQNYTKIQKEMSKNILPTKKKFYFRNGQNFELKFYLTFFKAFSNDIANQIKVAFQVVKKLPVDFTGQSSSKTIKKIGIIKFKTVVVFLLCSSIY